MAPKQVFDLYKDDDKAQKSTQTDDEPMSDKENSPFLPYSGKSVFGLDNHEQYSEHQVRSNFHARIIHQM